MHSVGVCVKASGEGDCWWEKFMEEILDRKLLRNFLIDFGEDSAGRDRLIYEEEGQVEDERVTSAQGSSKFQCHGRMKDANFIETPGTLVFCLLAFHYRLVIPSFSFIRRIGQYPCVISFTDR